MTPLPLGQSDSPYQRDNAALRKENERLAAELAACREERRGALIFGAALRVIRGPSCGVGTPFMDAYQAAGGGYEGLQAIARTALDEVKNA